MFHFKDNYGKELRCSNISGIWYCVSCLFKVMFCVDTLYLKLLSSYCHSLPLQDCVLWLWLSLVWYEGPANCFVIAVRFLKCTVLFKKKKKMFLANLQKYSPLLPCHIFGVCKSHLNSFSIPVLFKLMIFLGLVLFVRVVVLRPSQPTGVMSSAVSLPNYTFTGQI